MTTGKELISDETSAIREVMAVNLKKMREAKGFTQAQMAEIAHVETNTYQRYEYANVNIPVSKLYRICVALDCNLDELLVPSRPGSLPRPATRKEPERATPPEPLRRTSGGWIQERVMIILRRPPGKTPPK